ncbi:MAG TPA: adenylate/guanylate cyclase domain-containing protein [Reyranella sp.]|jgi:adenylate cyclase|nr:adenylate/guanylate cyclase domain-containing protein [Reyranella sp.]
MDDEIPNRVYGDPLARWFVTEAYRITDTGQLIGAAGEQLVAAGIPLYRLAYFQLTLHPEFAGKAYTWRRGHGVEVSEATHGLMERSEYLDNPLPPVFEQRRTVRVRLEAVEPQAPILKQLKQNGATDYVALPLLFTTGHVDALSVVSDRPGGFSADDLDRMFQLQFAFTRIVETHSLRDTAENLLDAYVGRAAGQRILAGEVKRGDGQTIEAVLWYCDLRGFTRASDRLPRDAIIALLNDYFSIMGGAVTSAGGEILKFMGDGMLAMLPIASPAERSATVARAAEAAVAAYRMIAALNLMRTTVDEPAVRFGLALHVGEVMFGNIGASARLDFTVIGPAVNHAARLEKLCGQLDRPIVVSQALAALLPEREVVLLGHHLLKDIDAPQPVYSLSNVSPG